MPDTIVISNPWPKDMISVICVTCSQAVLLPNGLHTCLAEATPTQNPCLSLTPGSPKVLSYRDLLEMNSKGNSVKIKTKEVKEVKESKRIEPESVKVETPKPVEKAKPKPVASKLNSQIGMF